MRRLNVRIHRLLYQRYTKSRGHYLRSNDILFTPYLSPHIVNFGNIGVDREVQRTNSIDQKSGKIEFLKNNKSFMQKTLKPTYFMNEMHEYDFKSFSKTLEFNPDLSKQDYDTFCPQNSIKEHILY